MSIPFPNSSPGRQTRRGAERGAALLSTMMGLAIGGIIVSMVTTAVTRGSQSLAVLSSEADLRDLRLRLAIQNDCAKVKAAHPTCNVPYIALLDESGKPLVAKYTGDSSATRYSRYLVRAECRGGRLAIKVATQRLGMWDWTNARDLYGPGVSTIFSCPYL